MTGCPGVFAGGDMVPSRAHRHRRRGARQEGGAPHRRLPARDHVRAAAEARRRDVRCAAPVVLRRRAAPHPARDRTRRARGRLRRGRRRADRRAGRTTRRIAACRAATASSATAAWAPARRMRLSSSAKGTATASTTTAVPVAEPASNSARYTRSRWNRSPNDARDDRRQRGGGIGRVSAQRGLLHLPHHPVVADGRTLRRVGQQAPYRTYGAACRWSSRCRAKAARRERCTGRCRAGR